MATRILIVDDEPPIIDILEYNLRKANYEVIVARDGQEALEKARRQRPDLVILDLMLPKRVYFTFGAKSEIIEGGEHT